MNPASYFFRLPVGKNSLCAMLSMLLALLWGAIGYAGEETSRQAILNRIKPVGSVRLQPDPSVPTLATAQTTAVQEPPGEATYKQYCSLCHASGLAGAPKFRDAADWKPRLANRDIKALVESALKGKNVMPPKGTCADCQAEDLEHAIQYMLPR